MNPETHQCWTCGYEWKHGQDGGHDCGPILRRRVEKLEARVRELEEAARPRRPSEGELPNDEAAVVFELEEGVKLLGRYDALLWRLGWCGFFVNVESKPERAPRRACLGRGMYWQGRVARWWPAPQAPEERP